jgi:hypothetical protein
MFKFESLMHDGNIIEESWKYYDIEHDLPYVLKLEDDGYGQKYKDLDISTVVYEGGGEGGGEKVVRVYKIVDHVHNEITYIRRTGCYYSYDGIEWDDTLEQVYPKSVEVIMYHNAAGEQYDEVGEV